MSIQSSVAYGHVGNSAATFPLMRLGHEVWPVLTVHFSNHTGYGAWRGPLLAPEDIRDVISGIGERGVLPECDAVLSGYQGAQAVGEVILDAVAQVKQANPTAVYCCDPVMGDVGRGFFVAPGIPEFMRDHVIPAAQIATPNQFELEFLTGRTITTQADLIDAAKQLQSQGPATVLVTSAQTDSTPDGCVQLLSVGTDGIWITTTPHLPLAVNGAGDATAAMFLAHHLMEGPKVALERTTSAIFGILQATEDSGLREIQLVAAQDEIVTPSQIFDATWLAA